MSVRKSTLRASSGQSAGVSLLKNVGFWAFMLIGSFLIGFLIISPLINVASGSRTESKPNAGVATSPSPASNNAPARSVQPERRRGENESPIEIRSDRSESTRDVQPPASVEGDGSSRTERPVGDEAARTESSPGDSGQRLSVESGSGTQAETPDRSRATEDRGHTDSSEQTESRRGRRGRRAGEETGGRTTESGDNGIQRSEGIDR